MTDYSISQAMSSEAMARAVERYIVARYPNESFSRLSKRNIQLDDAVLVRALFDWRLEHNWKSPGIFGETRCVNCTALMRDGASYCEDENVCKACAAALTDGSET